MCVWWDIHPYGSDDDDDNLFSIYTVYNIIDINSNNNCLNVWMNEWRIW